MIQHLKGASEFVYLDYLKLPEVYAWLSKYNFKDEEIEYIWNRVGGYNYILSRIIEAKEKGEEWREVIGQSIQQAKAKIIDFLNGIEDKRLRKEVYDYLKELIKQGKDREELKVELENNIREVIRLPVDSEILLFDSLRAELWIQFKSYYFAMCKIFLKKR